MKPAAARSTPETDRWCLRLSIIMQWACNRNRGSRSGRARYKGAETPACPKRSPLGDEGAEHGRAGYPDTGYPGTTVVLPLRPVLGERIGTRVADRASLPTLLGDSQTALSRTG